MVHFRSTTESTVIEKSRYFLCWVIYEVIEIIVCLCLLISVNQFSYNFIGRVSYPIFQYFQEIFLKGITQKIMCGFIRLINTFLPFIHNEPKFSLSLWAQASILTEPIIPCIFKKKMFFFCLKHLVLERQHSVITVSRILNQMSQVQISSKLLILVFHFLPC